MVIVTQALVYTSLAFIVGTIVVRLSPLKITIPKRLMSFAIAIVVICAALPVMKLINYLSAQYDWLTSITTVLFTFEVGRSWLLVALLATVLLLISKAPASLQLLVAIAMVLAFSWSSHASSFDQTLGFIWHAVHTLAVSIWVGVLLVVSLFGKEHQLGKPFRQWFTPLAIGALLAVSVSGVLLVATITPDYVTVWQLPYGQALLIKHALILPLIGYAFINGVLNRNAQRSSKAWLQAESVVMLMIFTATAVLSVSSPDSDNEPQATLYQAFHANLTTPHLQWTIEGIAFLLASIICSYLLLQSFRHNKTVKLSLVLAFTSALTSYCTAMLMLGA